MAKTGRFLKEFSGFLVAIFPSFEAYCSQLEPIKA
jgi:hypothetical protein